MRGAFGNLQRTFKISSEKPCTTLLVDRTFREPLLGGSVAGRQGDRRGPPSVSTVNEASKHPSVTLKGFLFGETKTLSFPFVVVSFPLLCSCFVCCLVWCRRFWVRFVSFTSVRLLHCFALSTSQVLEARSPISTTNNVEDHHDDHNDAANSWRLLAKFLPAHLTKTQRDSRRFQLSNVSMHAGTRRAASKL